MNKNILSIKNLSINFGGILALNKVSFDVKKYSITSLIGPNGAGKTTLFNCVTGFYRISSGGLLFQSKKGEMDIKKVLGEKLLPIDYISPVKLVKKIRYKIFGGVHLVVQGGLVRTFQNIRLFRDMTVMENLLIAQHHSLNHNLLSGIFQTKNYQLKEKNTIAKAYEILKLFQMTDDANKISSSLPYGKERKIEIARALCCNEPSIICLDEPAAGLNLAETEELNHTIKDIRDKMGITIFLIEHDMSMVMEISDYIVVLDHGKTITKGIPQMVKNDPRVIEAYLGKKTIKKGKNE